jgi:hypothetical protein
VEITKTRSGYGVYAQFIVDYSQFYDDDGNIIQSYHTPPAATSDDGCVTSQGTQVQDKYKDIVVTAYATWSDWYNGSTMVDSGYAKTKIQMDVRKDDKTLHKKYFVLPASAIGNGLNLPKAYIPIKWKDNTNWTMKFLGVIDYKEIEWTDVPHTGSHSYSCGNEDCGGHTCSWCYYTCTYKYNQEQKTVTASASILINGNMYEDDFTGSKH